MISYKDKEMTFNSYSNISEFYNWLVKTPRRRGADNSSEKERDSEWAGASSLQEAYDYLIGGNDDMYKKFTSKKSLEVEKILGNVINKNKIENDIVGFQPNVPNFLLGLPTDMLNMEPKKTSQKIINIALSITASAGVGSSDIEKAGMLYLQILDLLEKTGYRVNLYLINTTRCYGNGQDNYYYSMVRIKTDREPLNIKKCVYPIVSPAMHRRIFFKWDESCDADYEFTQDCYGCPDTDTKRIKNYLDKILKTNFIIWKMQDSSSIKTENVLEELKKQGIKIGE